MQERAVEALLLNMCMITDPKTGSVLVQDKRPKTIGGWGGVTFPGGHVEENESLLDSVKREVKEETGLDVWNVQPCGTIDWYHTEERSRFLVFLYKTSDFSGELLKETEEGSVYWLNPKELEKQKLAPDLEVYLELFHGNGVEAYGICSKAETGNLNILNG